MFIPRGKAVHENLATSFVLLEALVDDLCEGGFSGAVEIILRDTDGHVIIDRGKLSAAIERREGGGYSRTSVKELAARSRRERGRVSVYGFSEGVAPAIASRFLAQPLYTNLSTDFADLEKMLLKLSRERDRQWFVEITVTGGKTTLIHLLDDRCRIVTEEAESLGSERDGLDPSENRALGELLSDVNRQGGMFDVYFARPDAADLEETAGEEKLPEPKSAEPEPPVVQTVAPVVEDSARASLDDDVHTPFETPAPDSTAAEPDEIGPSAGESAPASTPLAKAKRAEPPAGQASALRGTGALKDAEAMVEIKRLMGEIARTIEVSAQAIEQRDSFSMYLRTGQLKIADRYPFLDPFGAEFEYLGGEIAFVGRAKPEEFIAGLTEALRLAVVGVAESSLQTSRLRARIAEDLRGLLDRHRADMERYGLDESIGKIAE